MPAITPFLCLVLISLLFYGKSNEEDNVLRWHNSVLSAAVVWGVLLTALTELLSIFNLITFSWVLSVWMLANFVVLIHIVHINKTKKIAQFKTPKFSHFEIILLFGLAFIIMTLGIIALLAPPNTFDSMTYHMSRVFHWIQNRNVANYPTHITRQLCLNPWAEFAIMHFQILSGGDYLANFIQWFSMIGSLIGVSLIAQQLGANLRGQIFAIIVCSTIPMGITQASSTQNDYVASFWLVCFVYYIISSKMSPSRISLLAIGASLGLATLTKATVYLYACPFLLWFAFSGFKRYRWKIWKHLIIISATVFVLNLGYYIRNFEVFGHVLGDTDILNSCKNEIITIPLLLSNIIRNIGLHTGTPVWLINLFTYKVIKLLHLILGVSINDPRITLSSTKFVIPFSFHEDFAGNFFHLILIIFSVIIFIRSNQMRKTPNLTNYCMAAFGAFILLSLYLKWQPWHSRLHLPIFVLFSPFIATVLSKINNPFRQNKILLTFTCLLFLSMVTGWLFYDYYGYRLIKEMHKGESISFLNNIIERQFVQPVEYYFAIGDNMFMNFILMNSCVFLILLFLYLYNGKISNSIGIILILLSLPWIFCNPAKRIIGEGNIFSTRRIDQYFPNWQVLKKPYSDAIDYIKSKGCSDIGVVLGEDDWEYPFVALLHKKTNFTCRIEHVNVNNASSKKYAATPFNNFKPSTIILHHSKQNNDRIINKGSVYVKEWSFGGVSVYIKK